jgi:sulfatase modifying factor 1
MLSTLRRKRVQRLNIESYEKHGIWWYDDALHCGKHLSNLGNQRYSTLGCGKSFEYYRLESKPLMPYYKVANEIYNMILCPRGSFTKGSNNEEDENPLEEMSIEKSFLLGETEITQELYQAVMGVNPSRFQDDPKNPVEQVSWYDALMFCNCLSDMFELDRYYTFGDAQEITHSDGKTETHYPIKMNETSKGFRLPTRWEWEYAAKAGNQLLYSGSNNADDVAWFGDNAGRKTHPIKQKRPNSWGFYDMSGNVKEWCEGIWDGKTIPTNISDFRIVQNGSWQDSNTKIYSVSWGYSRPDLKQKTCGFRVCRYI